MDGGTELTGARPLAATVRKGVGQGAGEGEGSEGDPFRASKKVRQWRGGWATAVKAEAGRASVRGHSGLRIGARRSEGEAVGGGDDRSPFYRVGGERGGRVTEGNRRQWWCTMMVVEAAISGGDWPGRWWGVMRGVLRVFQERNVAHREAARARAREAAVAAPTIRPKE
jgi:hypothetical protein